MNRGGTVQADDQRKAGQNTYYGCFIILILILSSFLAVGLRYIILSAGEISKFESAPRQSKVQAELIIVLQLVVRYWKILVSMYSLSFVLGFLYSFVLTIIMNSLVIKMMTGFCVIMLICLIILTGYAHSWAGLAVSMIAFITFVVMIVCCLNGSKSIRRALPIIHQTIKFVKEHRFNIAVRIVIIYVGYILFQIFWFVSLICIQYQASKIQIQSEQIKLYKFLYGYWIFLKIFFTIFIYYVMVYQMAIICQKGFYLGINNYRVIHGSNQAQRRQKYSIMSVLTLSSLTAITFFSIFLLKIFQYLGTSAYQTQTYQGNCCGKYVLCCFQGLFKKMQFIIQILNRFTVITIAVQNKNFVLSANITNSLILKDISFFYVVSSTGQILKYIGIVFSAGVPTIIGYGLALLLYTDDGPEGYNKTALIFLIFFTSFANSLYAVSFFVAALSGVFYFKRLQKKRRQLKLNKPPCDRRGNSLESQEHIKSPETARSCIQQQ